MNKVLLNGKIIRVKPFEKVVYTTICVRDGKNYEYIPVTIFNVEFFTRYFHIDKWISIEGYIHTNEHSGKYTTEIIAEKIGFSGDANEMDKAIADIFQNEPE